MSDDLVFYLVRSKDGKYFRRKGYGGYGNNWVKDAESATVYQNIKGARTRVNYWATHYPDYGIPDIVKFTVSETEVINEAERIQKSQEKKEARQKRADLREKQRKLKKAQEDLKAAEERYRKLNGEG